MSAMQGYFERNITILPSMCDAAAKLGISKIRITGGEPLVRRGCVDLCRMIAGVEGIREIDLTTNGTLLPRYAEDLKAAGVTRVIRAGKIARLI